MIFRPLVLLANSMMRMPIMMTRINAGIAMFAVAGRGFHLQGHVVDVETAPQLFSDTSAQQLQVRCLAVDHDMGRHGGRTTSQ